MSAGPVPSENAECIAMVRNLRRRGCKVCKVASGADINDAKTQAILNTLGLEEGVTDYFVIIPGGHTIYLEMKKRQGGTVSKAQKAWHRDARALGAAVAVGPGAKQAVAQVESIALERWGVTLPP